MKTIALVAAVAMAFPITSGSDSELRTGPPRSPISITNAPASSKPPRLPLASAVDAAEMVAGSKVSSEAPGRLVQYEDRSPFGPSSRGTGWLLLFDIEVNGRDASTKLELNVLVDATSGRVVLAYTHPSGTWVYSLGESKDPEVAAAHDGWVMDSDVPDIMQSSGADAINATWKGDGIDPRTVGQIIARPRWISAKFPARKVDGQLIPIRPKEKVWLVQVCGAKLPVVGAYPYCTGKVLQFRDGSLEYVGGIYLP